MQFEMVRINICGIFETIRVIQGQHGLPQSRCKAMNLQSSHQSGVLFFILRENANS